MQATIVQKNPSPPPTPLPLPPKNPQQTPTTVSSQTSLYQQISARSAIMRRNQQSSSAFMEPANAAAAAQTFPWDVCFRGPIPQQEWVFLEIALRCCHSLQETCPRARLKGRKGGEHLGFLLAFGPTALKTDACRQRPAADGCFAPSRLLFNSRCAHLYAAQVGCC